jgi:hypothetical protein
MDAKFKYLMVAFLALICAEPAHAFKWMSPCIISDKGAPVTIKSGENW